MQELFEIIRRDHYPNPPASEAEIAAFEAKSGWRLDSDLRSFYQFSNGAKLFDKLDSPYSILPLEELERTRTAIAGSNDPQWGPDSWWAIADVQDGNYVAVDLGQTDSQGRFAIRDIFHEVPSDAEYCQIIALSFGEFLAQALISEGRHFWLK